MIANFPVIGRYELRHRFKIYQMNWKNKNMIKTIKKKLEEKKEEEKGRGEGGKRRIKRIDFLISI